MSEGRINASDHGHKNTIIGSVVVLIIIVSIVVGYMWYERAVFTERTNQGCTPETWNQWGSVVIWSCPDKEEIEREAAFYYSHGCTRSGDTYSCPLDTPDYVPSK